MTPQPSVMIAGESAVIGAWTGEVVTAESAPEPAAATAPVAEPTQPDAPAESEREKSSGEVQWEWFEEHGRGEDWDAPSPEEEAEAEANAPHTCEGSGIYGDYSPEGYADC